MPTASCGELRGHPSNRELRAKDMERTEAFIADLRSKEKRGLTKEQKEELASAEKVEAWLKEGKDVRYE